jgi:hypothetical protein
MNNKHPKMYLSRAKFDKNIKILHQEEVEEAKRTPAYDAYRGYISFFLGIHQFLAGNILHGLLSVALNIIGASLFFVAVYKRYISKDFEKFSCYPDHYPHEFGYCYNKSAEIYNMPGVKDITPDAFYYLYIGIGAFCITVNILFVNLTKRAFIIAADHELEKILKGKEPRGIYAVLFLIESFLFGYHYKLIGYKLFYRIHKISAFSMVTNALLFFLVAIYLDPKFRCYPGHAISTFDQGYCDDVNSQAHKLYKSGHFDHVILFWISLLGFITGTITVIGLFSYVVPHFKEDYLKYVRGKKHLV